MKIYHIVALLAITMLASCRTPKNITYFQDVENGSNITVDLPFQVKVQPGDKLRIIVSTQDNRLSELFNLQSPLSNRVSTSQSDFIVGYTVDQQGCIDFPVIGNIKIAGMTRAQIAEYIKKELQDRELVKDPVVVIDYLNLGVVVLGDVRKPGHFNITNDRYTVLEAIADAGDLTITGERTNVKVIRQMVGKQEVYEINLLDAESLYTSPAYFLQQNDMVYVEPNDKAKRESTPIGNTLLSSSFWISVSSVAISLAVMINNVTRK